MKRKILLVAICYIIGTIGGLYLKWNIILFLYVLLIFLMIFFKMKLKLIIAITFAISIFMVFIRASYTNKFYNYSGEIVVYGVISEVDNTSYYNKITIQAKKINDRDVKFKQKFYVYKKGNSLNLTEGNYIKVVGEPTDIQESRNYKGFNYKNYLKSKQVYGIIKTENVEIIQTNKLNMYQKFVISTRNSIKNIIYKYLSPKNAELCKALILGEKNGVEDEIIQNFSEGGLSHVLAISGMHVAYVAAITAIFVGKTLGKRNGNWATIFSLIFFCNLSHNSESVFRATVMLILYNIAKLTNRKSDSITNLSISTVLSLLINPYCIYNVSFLLSSAGALGIITFYRYVNKIQCKNKIILYIKNQISIGVSANLTLIPIVMLYFNKLSLIFLLSSPVINCVISILMPTIIVFIICGFFNGSLALIISKLVMILTEILVNLGEFFSKLKPLNILVKTPANYSLICYYVILILLYRKLKYGYLSKNTKKIFKYFFIGYLIVCLLARLIYFVDTSMKIYFIDVGQGDSTLIITPNKKKILIDGGGSEMGEDTVGKNILLPYLLDRNIKSLDYVFFSHFDSDHCRWTIYDNRKY